MEKITCAGKVIDLEDDIGLSIVIHADTISKDESLDLMIQPSFSGPFEMPDDIEPTSPAYLIEIRKKIHLKKPLSVRMKHYAGDQMKEKMVFLRASSDPEYRGSEPVYVFKEVEDAMGRFNNDGSQTGEIELQKFSWWRIGGKKIKGS